MAVTMEGLEFQIETKSSEGTKGIDALSRSLNRLNKALGNINTSKLEGLGEVLNSIGRLGEIKISKTVATQLGSIAEAMGQISTGDVERLERMAAALDHLSSVGNVRLPRINTPTTGVGDSVGTSGAATSAQEAAASVEQVTTRTLSLRNVLSGIGGVFRTGFSVGVGVLRTLGGALANVASTAGRAAINMLGFGKTSAGLASQVKHVTSGLGKLFSSLKRIAMYRLFRWAISSITKSFKEGVNNLYQYSNALGGAFAISMNSAATNALYLKNSLGAMAAPIINALAPAIDFVTGKIVNLLNLINKLISILSGRGTYTAAKKMEKSYGDAFKGAGGSAKKAAEEIARFTTGIDELNIIQENPETGGGGGGGLDYGSMFEELPINSSLAAFGESLATAFNNADWDTLGSLIGTKFNEIIDSIDYEGLGSKIGFGLNGIFATLYSFLDTTNFTNIGSHLGTLINAGLEEWDLSTVGALMIKKLTILPDLIIGFLVTLDWGLVAKSLGDYVVGAFDEASKWFSKYDWSKLGSTLWKKIKEAVTNVDWSAVATSMFTALGSALGATVAFLDGFIGDIWTDVSTYFSEKIEECGGDFVAGLFKGIADALSGVGQWILDNVVTPLIEGFKAGFGIHSPSTVMQEQGGFVTEGFLNGILAPFLAIGEWVDTNIVQPLVAAFGETDLAEFTVGVKNTASTWWKNVQTWWKKESSPGVSLDAAINLVKSGWNTVKEWIGNIPVISQAISLLKSGWTTIKDWIGTHIVPVGISLFKDGWSTLSSWIGTSVSVGISLFKDGWNSLKSFFGLADGGVVAANGGMKLFSSGGSIHNGATEFWNAIPKYAGGTANAHGSMFVAGERGAELVGHVNGRTEVLNKSQLGQVMHRSIVDGMMQFAGYWGAINTHMSTCTNALISAMLVSSDAVYAGVNSRDVYMTQSVSEWMDNLGSRVEAALSGAASTDKIAEGVREGMFEVTARQNDLLREQNDLLQRLLNKDMTVQIGNKTIKEAVVTQDNADGYRFTK